MIFMQQLQYSAPNLMYVFKIYPGGYILEPPFGTVTLNQAPSPSISLLRAWPNGIKPRLIYQRWVIVKVI